MAKSKGPIPEGFHTVTPYLVMPGIAGLMEFSEAGVRCAGTGTNGTARRIHRSRRDEDR
jgi:hypothetical protein